MDERELVEHASFLQGLALHLLSDEHRAQDAVQDTFVAAITSPQHSMAETIMGSRWPQDSTSPSPRLRQSAPARRQVSLQRRGIRSRMVSKKDQEPRVTHAALIRYPFKYVWYERYSPELYDLSWDPAELSNQAKYRKDLVENI